MADESKTTNASPVAIPPASPRDPDPAAGDPSLNEDSTLALLKRADLSPDLVEKLGKSGIATKSRKVQMAIVRHPNAPRYVSLSLLRKLFTFDLMRVALTPEVVGDLKLAAEEALIHRLETISAGEKLSLARRASGRVVGELLLDTEPRIIQSALENPRLTESVVTKALLCPKASPALAQAVCTHSKWSLRWEIRVALLRNEHTPPHYAVEFAKSLPNDLVKEILQASKLPESVRAFLSESSEL